MSKEKHRTFLLGMLDQIPSLLTKLGFDPCFGHCLVAENNLLLIAIPCKNKTFQKKRMSYCWRRVIPPASQRGGIFGIWEEIVSRGAS